MNYTEKVIATAKKFDQFACVRNFEYMQRPRVLDTDSKVDENPLLDVIYGVDENTKLPKGDIALYLSDRTTPEVRTFIQQNLMSDLPVEKGLPDGEDVTPFIREKGESAAEYGSRLAQYLNTQREKDLLAKKVESKSD